MTRRKKGTEEVNETENQHNGASVELDETEHHDAGGNGNGGDNDDAGGKTGNDAGGEAEGKTGSIVKSKYAGRYKEHHDDLSKLIADQCVVEGNFNYGKFFELCTVNGIKDEHIEPYKPLLSGEKIGGLAGRARMTLRNRLAGIVRRGEGKLKLIDGSEVQTSTAPIPVRTPTTDAKAVDAAKEPEAAAA